MAGGWLGTVNIYGFLYIIFILIGSSLSYLEYTLENGKVCSQIRKRELKLGEKEISAISLKELRYFDKWSGLYPFNCTFTVIAPWGYGGIIAVIQNVVLRENETTMECTDYVQFQKRKQTNFFLPSDYIRSKKFCGKVNTFHDPEVALDSEDSFIPALNAFVDEKSHLDVTISVAAQRLLPAESLDISIIFTAFKICKDGDFDGFRECRKGSGICIWEGFFDDKYVNCPFDDCFDEGGCPVMSGGKKQSSGLGTKVTIGAVVLILGLLLLFLLCLFVCRRCQVLCWAAPTSPRQRTAQQTTRVEMTAPSSATGNTGAQTQPTAPPLLPVTSVTSVQEDKDLPPPYESLFPSR